MTDAVRIKLPKDRPLAEVTDCELCCAWISPDGRAAHVNMGRDGWGSHCNVARQIGDESGGRGLDERLFLHLSYGNVYIGGHRDAVPTQAQLDRLFDHAMELKSRSPYNSSARYIMEYIESFQKEVAAS